MSDIDLSLDYTKYPNTGLPEEALSSSSVAGYETSIGDVGTSAAGSNLGSGRGVVTESLNDRASALALAAGANVGDKVTVNGQEITVSKAAAQTTKPPKPKNKRLDEHIPLPDKNLVQGKVLANGDHEMRSLDKAFLGMVQGFANKLGFNVHMHDADGTLNHSSTGGVKNAHAHETKTISGSSSKGVGGAQHSTTGKGGHSEDGGGTTSAVNGTTAKTTAQSDQTFSQGGNASKPVKGDYTLSAKEGGIHMDADKEITFTAKGKNIGLSTKTGTITLTAGDNYICISPRGINIVANTGPITVFSRNHDVHVAAEKYISVQSYSKDVTVTTPSGKIDLNP